MGQAVGVDATAVLDRSSVVTVGAAIAPLHPEPRVSAPQVTQALAGHPLFVRETQGEWLRVFGADAYEGWVHRGYVLYATLGGRVGDAGMVGTGEDARPVVRWSPDRMVSLGCIVRTPGVGARALPLGAVLRADEEVVESGIATRGGELAARFPPAAAAVARTATERFAGTSYLWGGVTPWGADCSGLVQTVFGLHGVTVPRDAWQQALIGEPAEDDPTAAAAGTLLFFSDRDDGRLTHVGIAGGGGSMVHLALGRGGWAVERLRDKADPYVATLRRNFRLARRVL